MEQSGLAKLRSVEGRQDSTTNGRMKAGNTLKLQPLCWQSLNGPYKLFQSPTASQFSLFISFWNGF